MRITHTWTDLTASIGIEGLAGPTGSASDGPTHAVYTRDRLGIPLSDTYNQYLAYHDGRAGYARGSYKSKAWLVDVAQKVARRAEIYNIQLSNCRHR